MQPSTSRVVAVVLKVVWAVCRRLGLDVPLTINRSLSHYENCRLALNVLRDRADRITVGRNGTSWTCHAWDAIITEQIFVNGSFNGKEIRSLLRWMEHHQRLSEDRNVIINIGANIGTTSIPLAQQTACHVLAIEPIRSNFLLLRENVDQNSLDDRITCVQAAIDVQAGVRRMAVPQSNCGGGIISSAGTAPRFAESNEARERTEVRADTLRHILEEQRISPHQVAFVWSDTEGSEFRVIETGQELWRAGVPLYVEIFPEAMRMQHGLDRFIQLANRYFERFVECPDLVADGAEARSRPVGELPDLVDRLDRAFRASGLYIADVLLLPAMVDPSRSTETGS